MVDPDAIARSPGKLAAGAIGPDRIDHQGIGVRPNPVSLPRQSLNRRDGHAICETG
jgi:hypothetical protein